MCGEYAGHNSRMLLINILNVRQLVHYPKISKSSKIGQKFCSQLGLSWVQITGGDVRR